MSEKIITNPKILHQKSDPVTDFGEVKDIVSKMEKTMVDNNGAGLAAIQIGIKKRIIVMQYYDVVISLVNPEILEHTGNLTHEEICLSCPGKTVKIERPSRIKVSYYTPDNSKRTVDFDGILSRVVQHEIDHLDGILITD